MESELMVDKTTPEPSEGQKDGNTLISSLEHFFRQEVTFILFCGQILFLVFFSWTAGIMGFSLAWGLALAYFMAKYWSRIIDIHIWEQVTLTLAKKAVQSKNPRNESVEWANVIVDRWLRFSEPDIAEMMRTNINPILQTCKPSFLDSLEIGAFSLGSALPRISSLSISDMSVDPSESLVLERITQTLQKKEVFDLIMEFDIEQNCPDFLIQVVGKLKSMSRESNQMARSPSSGGSVFNLNVNIEKLRFCGHCQIGITFDRRVPFPHAKEAWIMFLDNEPQISMSIVTMHANVMALPKLNDWINSAIKTSLSDFAYYPHKHFIPLYHGPELEPRTHQRLQSRLSLSPDEVDQIVHVTATGSVKAKGVLLVTSVYGEPDNPQSVLNRSEDPIWCSVKLESEGQVTTARPGNRSWSDSLAFLIYNIDTEHLRVQVKTKSLLGKVVLGEYSVYIGKLGLKDGVEESIRPHKSTTQKKASRDLPDLLFKLTYHKLPSFALKDKMREFSVITEQLITPADLGISSALRASSESLTSSNTDLSLISNANEDCLEEAPKVISPKVPVISDLAGVASVLVHSGHGLPAMDLNGFSDPYVNIWFNGVKIKQSPPIKKTLNPVWNFYCDFLVADFTASLLLIEVFDWDGMYTKDDYIGRVELNLGDLTENKVFELRDEAGQVGTVGTIVVSSMFNPIAALSNILVKSEVTTIGNSMFYERSRSLSSLNLPSIGKPRTQTLNSALERRLGITEYDEDNDIEIEIIRASRLRAADPGGTSDPFCVITVDGNQQKFKTKVIDKTLDPVWNETLLIPYPNKVLEIKVMDKDLYRNDFLGRVVFITKDMTGENLLEKSIKQCAEDPNFEVAMDLKDKDAQGTLYFRLSERAREPFDGEMDFSPPEDVAPLALGANKKGKYNKFNSRMKKATSLKGI